MQRVKVSIIIPVYNVEEYLRDCLDSVVNQTLRDIEILCVDDGSPDGCGRILDEYAEKDKRIKVIHQENQGVSVARNVGIEKSTGEYVYIMDSDDWLDVNAMEVAYRKAQKENYELLFFNIYRYFEHSGEKKQALVQKYYKNKPYKYWSGGAAWWSLIKRSVLNDNKDIRFPASIMAGHGEDGIFTFKLYCKCKNIGILDNYLYYYRIRSGSSITRRDNVGREFLTVSNYFDIVTDWIDKYGNWERDAPRFISNIQRQVNSYVLRSEKYNLVDKCKVFSRLKNEFKRAIPFLDSQDRHLLRKELGRLNRINLLTLSLSHFFRRFKRLLYKKELVDRNKIVRIVGFRFIMKS